jgi:hypothetical protein
MFLCLKLLKFGLPSGIFLKQALKVQNISVSKTTQFVAYLPVYFWSRHWRCKIFLCLKLLNLWPTFRYIFEAGTEGAKCFCALKLLHFGLPSGISLKQALKAQNVSVPKNYLILAYLPVYLWSRHWKCQHRWWFDGYDAAWPEAIPQSCPNCPQKRKIIRIRIEITLFSITITK